MIKYPIFLSGSDTQKERRIQSSLHKSKFISMRRTSAAVISIPPAFLHLCSSTSNQPEYVRLTNIECQRRRKNCAQGRGGEKKVPLKAVDCMEILICFKRFQ